MNAFGLVCIRETYPTFQAVADTIGWEKGALVSKLRNNIDACKDLCTVIQIEYTQLMKVLLLEIVDSHKAKITEIDAKITEIDANIAEIDMKSDKCQFDTDRRNSLLKDRRLYSMHSIKANLEKRLAEIDAQFPDIAYSSLTN
jgi:hypothetical protein